MSKTLVTYLGANSGSLLRLAQALQPQPQSYVAFCGDSILKKDLMQAPKKMHENIMFSNIADIE